MNRRTALKAILTIPAVATLPVLATPAPLRRVLNAPLSKFPPVHHIDVSKFGATGNGYTDDSAALRLCLVLSTLYKLPLYFPNGTYRMGQCVAIQGDDGIVMRDPAVLRIMAEHLLKQPHLYSP